MATTATIQSYTPAPHFTFTEHHDMSVATRTLTDGTEQVRMECRCGTRSRWTERTMPLREAQDRHADRTSR